MSEANYTANSITSATAALAAIVAATRDHHRLSSQRPWTNECRENWNAVLRLKRLVGHVFGELNGWHTGDDVRDFNIEDIGKRSGSFARLDGDIFDHCIWYRANAKCAAIVAQPYKSFNPYNPADEADARNLAARLGLALHVPPHPLASIWYPNVCVFWVFTTPEHQIVWLPEQINGIAKQSEE
jgi:hypothetical protein